MSVKLTQMHIGIIGTRGIPNNHGGFEQFAQYLSLGLIKRGFKVSVYNVHNHPYKEKDWNGVEIIHCFNPETFVGTPGQFVYDLNCILDSRKRDFDVILQLGYTSSSIWGKLLPRKRSVITTNMDGFEWQRAKYSGIVKHFLKYAEKWAVNSSDHLIADSKGVQNYLKRKYDSSPVYIPYGAEVFDSPSLETLRGEYLDAYGYNMLVARMEPENSIETILDGVVESSSDRPFLVVGNTANDYGKYLMNKFKRWESIQFLGAIYDIARLNNLRYYSNLYFHGHTVGGTNPSLLEAMASKALVSANDNMFNRYILGNDGYYFSDSYDVSRHIKKIHKMDSSHLEIVEKNAEKISHEYSWPNIIDQYIEHFFKIARY